mgnify:CR=1 FL=1
MNGKKLVLVVACALVDPDGRVLIAQRPQGKAQAGLWEFPGGKVEPGEQPEVALIRELQEELGIDVTQACLAPMTFASHAYEDFHLLMPVYVCRRWNGDDISGRVTANLIQDAVGEAPGLFVAEKASDFNGLIDANRGRDICVEHLV